ncbi:efflux transporter outer membrane subunit [Wenzhouxiangella sp. AB-CW3]|uniref:efflux transporter outer membrane subunit n=1 Tax=Wenzhouxiangella sp. AB-CW3 TaxID=2771012 RepID=UPI00168AC61D|nr:efflux transporter outer membrane subunit [Wenzhouxiangella sp. AB-CW3]QOC23735.1 efflux transporter outer membrane subunit [Wenzhouxiangella sp. AB-CW3]
MNRRLHQNALVLTGLLLLAGCAVGPDYQRPELEAPAPVDTEQVRAHQQALVDWWQRFDDPVLDDLIERATSDNLEIRAALARLSEARARAGLARAERLPTVAAQAEAARERTPATAFPIDIPGAGATTANTFSVVGMLDWEVDLWGRLTREREAALAQLEQSRHAHDAVYLGIVTEVVHNYFALRSAEQQLRITERTLESRQRTLELEQIRFDAGEADELALRQAQTQLETTRAQLPARKALVSQLEGALGILVGMTPDELMGEIALAEGSIREIRVPELDLDDLPASLIERRPDIRAAEAGLMAATAGIGVAEAARLPGLSLGAMLGSIASDQSDLFSTGATAWNAGASLFGPVYDFGRSRSRIEVAEALREQAELNWRASVQIAFNEVRSALITLESATETIAAVERQVEVIARTEELAEIRYREGLVGFIELLDARRNLLDAELALSEAQREQLTAAATLFKALGGGWTVED